MARTLNKLTDTKAKSESRQGRHSDGGGLYLNVSPAGSKSWLFMWTAQGKRREMGLGAYPEITLAKARQRAAEQRVAVEEGRDPIAERKARADEKTFGECADLYIEKVKAGWRNAKHEYQWNQTLTQFCGDIRSKRISQITTGDVYKVLEPIWTTKNETASRLRGRIERVLEFAKTKGWRDGENPAAWRGNLRNLLPARRKLQRGHQPAMRYEDVPAFVERLKTHDALAARALEFTILTVARSGEALEATWDEIDFDANTWTLAPERMKAGEGHVVPLSKRAISIVKDLHEVRASRWVFPSPTPRPTIKGPAPLSSMSMLMLLRRMKLTDITVHGFRSSFRDWAGDATSFPRELAEAALAHKVGDETERAYRRSSALEKRRKMMQAWADFCDSRPSAKVIPMARGRQ